MFLKKRVNVIGFVKLCAFFTIMLVLDACNEINHKHRIIVNNNTIDIRSGILHQRLMLTESGIQSALFVQNDTAKLPVNEFSFVVRKAFPDERPRGMILSETGVELQDAERNQTDAMNVLLNKTGAIQAVEWTDSVMVCARKAYSFRMVSHRIDKTEKDKVRLILVGETSANPYEKNVVFEIVYEIYKDYPVIRKWMVFRNEGKHWLKIDHLLTAHIESGKLFPDVTHLTPFVRNIDPSVVAFGNEDASRGLIVASEVPSKPRKLTDNGQIGYQSDYFEWVLGPGESFESEPFIVYAFDGETYTTSNAVSTARDRCVEDGFRQFLKQHILMQTDTAKMVAPLFVTWTNYSANINENNMKQAADIASQIGFKCFQLDAGWSDAGMLGGWAVTSRNPDPERFKNLKAFNEDLKTKGMKAGLWYSVFINESDALKQNESTVLYSLPMVKRQGGLGLALAFEKARNRYADDVIYLNRTYGATYFKQDQSNICYGDIAEGHESRTLKESYLRGLRGLLAAQDRIHTAAPDAVLQLSHEIYWLTPGPAGDIAALKYVDIYHAVSNEYWGAGKRSQLVSDSWNMNKDSLSNRLIEGCLRARKLWYDHRGLPLERIEIFAAAITNYKGSLTPEIQDRQICSWLMGAPISFSGDLTSLTPENIERYHHRFGILNRLQKEYDIYSCFQYSGVPEPTDDGWHWWGKLNDESYGAVVVLRGNGGDEVQKINIPWVLPNRKYAVKGLFSNHVFGNFSGKQLQEGALELSLDRFGQEILEISKVSP